MPRILPILAGIALALLALGPGQDTARAADPIVELKFSEFYVDDFTIDFSDKLKANAGKTIAVRGYMAPPLKPSGTFVVLTRDPVNLCPYCETDADWPRDTLAVYLRTEQFDPTNKIKITGRLELGSKTDPTTGFVSLVRLVDAAIAP
jgi:hypothetical protein